MNYSFLHIPDHLWSEISFKKHIEYKHVYRFVENANSISKSDFYPSNIENKGKQNAIKLDISHYSVSLLYDKISVEEYKKKYSILKNKDVVCGFTTINRGISTEKNIKGHIDYFLFDYENNNPYTDFGDCNE